MIRLGYGAVTLGAAELQQWFFVRSLLSSTDLPVVCTNIEMLVDEDWVPVGQRTLLIEVNGLRILPGLEADRRAAASLRDDADIIVLLAHINSAALSTYADELPDDDIILGGHQPRSMDGPELASGTIVNCSRVRGMTMAVTKMSVSSENEIVAFGGTNVQIDEHCPEDSVIAADADQVYRMCLGWR